MGIYLGRKEVGVGVMPTGTVEITENGEYDVRDKAVAVVNVEADVEETPYERPADWLPIPELDGTKDEIYLLNGVSLYDNNILKFQAKTRNGEATIDWGDGTTDTITTTTKLFEHSWEYTNIADSSYTEHNNTKQVLIHIIGERNEISLFDLAYDNDINQVYEIKANVEICEFYCGKNNKNPCRFLEVLDWLGKITNTTMSNMFQQCSRLKAIINLDTSNVTDMRDMFYNCSSLTSLDVSNFNTSKVTSMWEMFYGCSSLTSLDVSNFDTSKVTDMYGMFRYCSKLTNEAIQKIVNKLDTSKVTTMKYMFEGCKSLISLDLSNFDTSNVTDMYGMFSTCSILHIIHNLNVAKTRSMPYAFSNCYMLSGLPKLSLSNLQTIGSAFKDCGRLKKLSLYNIGASNYSSISVNISDLKLMNNQAILDLINSVAPNTNSLTRTLQLGSTLQGYVANTYCKDSGVADTYILPTSDTEVVSGKTYYTYDKITDQYTEFTGSTFESGTFYYELVTASWNKYVLCESTDEGAMLVLDYARNIKGWTIS